jgi:hypothetical protein
MSATAYLVVFLDTTKSPPIAVEVGIYPQCANHLERGLEPAHFGVDSFTATAPTYHLAKQRLLAGMEEHAVLHWMKPLFRANDSG